MQSEQVLENKPVKQLTGMDYALVTMFDSQPLNTLYVDKNLKHHGLI